MSAALELLNDACIGLTVKVRKMFGGYGFFAPNGGMFAGIVTDDEIIFKLADATARSDLVRLGGVAWVYDGKSKPMTMSDWIVIPHRFYDDPEELHAWAQRAFQLAPAKVARKSRAASKTVAKPKQKAAPRQKKRAPRVLGSSR